MAPEGTRRRSLLLRDEARLDCARAMAGAEAMLRWPTRLRRGGALSRAVRAGSTARQGLTTLLDQGVFSITNFLTGVIVARSSSTRELGLYSLGFGMVVLLTAVQTSLISVPYNVYAMRIAEGERRAYTGSTAVHQLILSLLSVALLGTAGLLLARGAHLPGMGAVASTLAVAIPFILAREYGRQLLFSRLRFSSALLLDVVVAAVQLGTLLLLARSGLLSARTAYLVIGGACAVAIVIAVMMARGLFALVPSRVLPAFRANWTTGRWSVAAGAIIVAGAQLYPWFMAATRGAGEAGVFAACLGITALTNPLLIGMGNFVAPKIMHAFASGGLEAVQRVTRLAMGVVIAAMVVVCPLLFVAGGKLLEVVYGEGYGAYGFTVGVIALSQFADWLSLPAHHALFFMDRAKVMFKGNLIVLVVTVGLGLALVTRLGTIGAAVGLLVGNSLATAYKWREYRKRIGSATVDEVAAGAAAYGAGS
jgi:O-antigen/teichoic acid export membrane protein